VYFSRHALIEERKIEIYASKAKKKRDFISEYRYIETILIHEANVSLHFFTKGDLA